MKLLRGTKAQSPEWPRRLRRMLSAIVSVAAAALVFVLVMRLAFALPEPPGASGKNPVPDGPSALADKVSTYTANHPGSTGLDILQTGLEAFATRAAQARAATRTIDAQYYIWNGDLAGRLLLAEMIAAADRGVRVRLLIDDNPTAGLDNMWAAADSHPNIEVRLFNPLAVRKPRAINYLFDPFRLNRRMHNKSITYDSAVSIVGGRNVGDEYFGASSQGLFIDLDALAIGDVVPAIEDEFERYWTSASAFPAGMLLPLPPEGELEHLRNPVFADESLATAYRAAAYDMATLKEQTEPIDGYIWASVRLVADNPAKALDKAEASDLMALQIAPVIAGAKERFDLVSGYFVPSDVGTQLIAQRAIEGAKVRVVTNSIKVTDVPVVHAGYAPWRKPLLQSGVELYEARPLSDQHPGERGDLGRTRFSGGGESVHAKTFAIDNRTVFVGSFNFDPRSALLNCEMGLLIESPEIARAVGQTLDERLGPAAYAVSLDDNGKMRWTAGTGEDARTFDTEPNTTMMDRALIRVLSLLPIEWLL